MIQLETTQDQDLSLLRLEKRHFFVSLINGSLTERSERSERSERCMLGYSVLHFASPRRWSRKIKPMAGNPPSPQTSSSLNLRESVESWSVKQPQGFLASCVTYSNLEFGAVTVQRLGYISDTSSGCSGLRFAIQLIREAYSGSVPPPKKESFWWDIIPGPGLCTYQLDSLVWQSS